MLGEAATVMGSCCAKPAAQEPKSPEASTPPATQKRMARGSIVQAPSQVQRAKERERLVATDGTRTVQVPGSRLVLKYAFLSQRGCYPGGAGGRAGEGKGRRAAGCVRPWRRAHAPRQSAPCPCSNHSAGSAR